MKQNSVYVYLRLYFTIVLVNSSCQSLISQSISDFDRMAPSTEFSNTPDSFKQITRYKPAVLSGGSIDFINNRQLSTTTQVFRLYIGEPGKFQLPVSIFTGVSSNKLPNSRQQDELAANLINPGAGLLNIFAERQFPLIVSPSNISSILIPAQCGVRILSGHNPAYRALNFFNAISWVGITFLTGVWEKNNLTKPGFCWVSFRTIYSYSPSSSLIQFFADSVSSSHFGYSGSFGLEISSTLSFRINYFHFLTHQHMAAFRTPVLQLSVNYSSR
jgi:hypothetical protein